MKYHTARGRFTLTDYQNSESEYRMTHTHNLSPMWLNRSGGPVFHIQIVASNICWKPFKYLNLHTWRAQWRERQAQIHFSYVWERDRRSDRVQTPAERLRKTAAQARRERASMKGGKEIRYWIILISFKRSPTSTAANIMTVTFDWAFHKMKCYLNGLGSWKAP